MFRLKKKLFFLIPYWQSLLSKASRGIRLLYLGQTAKCVLGRPQPYVVNISTSENRGVCVFFFFFI